MIWGFGDTANRPEVLGRDLTLVHNRRLPLRYREAGFAKVLSIGAKTTNSRNVRGGAKSWPPVPRRSKRRRPANAQNKNPARLCGALLLIHTKTWDFLVVVILLSWDERPTPEFSASGRTTTVHYCGALFRVVKVLVLRRQHEHAVVYVEVDVRNRKISRFDDFAERHIVAVAGADKDPAAIVDEELP